MKVLLTGGTGSVGVEVTRRLVAHGHLVRVIGRKADVPVDGAEYRACDVTDFATLRSEMRGFDAVAHLAAIPSPMFDPDEEVIRVNVAGSFNVYHAAAELGIRRVVSASSINAFGYHWGVARFPVRYLPIDEEHPTRTTDCYSLSKQLLEEIAAYAWRREGISGCCLRLPWVANATPEVLARVRGEIATGLATLREWIALPPADGAARAGEVLASKERARAARMEEYPRDHRQLGELPHAALVGSYSNFFTQVDARDSAQAFEKALLASYDGSHPLFVNDSVNRYLVESRALARLFFPEAEARPSLQGAASLVSIDRARRLIGYEPEHTIDRIGVHG